MAIHVGGATVAARTNGGAHLGLRVWLYAIAALIVAMVIVGGATRLTGSGLSITEWKPIMGTVPPLTDADWQEAFRKYQEIPQYKILNRGMSLGEFKGIFWWEWAHRFLGRFIGVAFLLPFLAFWARGALPRGVKPKLAGIFVLGGLQGALGWYMVASGLVDRVSVSQYRLAAHLGLAVVVLGAVLWVAFDLGRHGRGGERRTEARWRGRGLAWALLGLVYLQILAGALVAGLHAGMGYNTWPLMDGALVPGGLGAMQPWWVNAFENALTVQFDHRILAYVVAVMVVANLVVAWGRETRGVAVVLALAVAGQVALGVFTLLTQVQLGLALAHQAGAILVFGVALNLVWRVNRC